MNTTNLHRVMHQNLITDEGAAKVDRGWMTQEPCCTGNCNQGRNCPTRQACELPITMDEPIPEVNVLARCAQIALAIASLACLAFSLRNFASALGWW